MGQIQKAKDGVFPAKGTKVRYLGSQRNAWKGKIGYVCEHPASRDRGIVFNEDAGQYHGTFCDEWEVLGVEGLDEDTKKELRELALAAAKKRGYCDETKKILDDLGLSPKVKRTITVEVPEGATLVVTANDKPVGFTEATDNDW